MVQIEDGRVSTDTKDVVLDSMMATAKSSDVLGEDLNDDQLAVIRLMYDPVADKMVELQELAALVLDSTQLEHAQGDALDLLTGLINVRRQEAAPATGRVSLFAGERGDESAVTQDYTVPSGTIVQTDALEPIEFETTEGVTLHYIHGFEDQDLTKYTGDNADFSVVDGSADPTPAVGTYQLKCGATASQLLDVNFGLDHGCIIHFRVYAEAGTNPMFLYGTQDGSNTYRVNIDEGAGSVALEVVEGGAVSATLDSAAVTVPAGDYLHGVLAWKDSGLHELTLYDSADAEVATLAGSETQITFEEGGYGFESGDTAGNKYWDEVAMEAVSAPIQALEADTETNVGTGTLVVLSNPPQGINDVYNYVKTSGGRDRERDDELRERAREELADAAAASVRGIYSAIIGVSEDVRNVAVEVNDTNSDDADGRPAHSFEFTVDAPDDLYDEIAQAIEDAKAAGDTSFGGVNGTKVTRTVDLPTGQTKEIDFSVPTTVDIYVNVDLSKGSTYEGDDAVRDAIVEYIGGILSDGSHDRGELSAGDDVIYFGVVDAIMDVPGVHDISTLEIDTVDPPAGTTNIAITESENATTDASGTDISVTSSDA